MYYDTKKKEISTIGKLLLKPKEVKKHCTYEWQDKAFEIAEKLGIDFKVNKTHLGNWLRLFKTAYGKGLEIKLNNCYSFISDYPRSLSDEGKIKMFFWRYHHKLSEIKSK